MPLFGDKLRFAAESDLASDPGGPWMFGRLRFWCGGLPVGDFERGTSLRDALFQLETVERYWRQRQRGRFAGMPAVQVFRLLDAALYGRCDIDNQMLAEQEEWARFNVLPDLDIFEGWKVFLLETPTAGCLILSPAPYDAVSEIVVAPGEVDSVLKLETDYLRQQYAVLTR